MPMNIDLKKIDSFIEENRENILRDIARLVKIPSVEGKAAPGAPYGEEPKRALMLGLEIAKEMGLKARNCEDRIGYAEIEGESEKYLSTITHLDVVPVGDGWSEDPFTMREKEGYIIGRGVMDDKGPSVICLYALKFIKEQGEKLRYPIRALLGSNEETGMLDVIYYLENYPAPAFCFSPDSNFPVCNGEKGIFQGEIISEMPLEKIVSISGGFAPNAIPDKAYAAVKFEGKVPAECEDISVSAEGDLLHITASGKGGHASMPEGTKNAIGVLVNFILKNDLCGEGERDFFELLKKLHDNTAGENIGVSADDGKFSPLTIVGGMISVKDGKIHQSLDSRFPTNTSGEKIAEIIRAQAGDFAAVVINADEKPFYISPESPEIETCISTYNEITGENAELYTMGGGTYARDFPNAVSFGPEHPERPAPDFAGPVHGVDEAASVADLMEALKIYIVTLMRLEEVDF